MRTVVLGVGNVLEEDDGVGIYACAYLNANYTFTPDIEIINGGVEGINLLNLFMENDRIIILDTINLDDEAGSIYNIPSYELSGYGLNSGGAHEVGVMQCLDMIELMGHPLPESNVIGIIPKSITFNMGLSDELSEHFSSYINTVINYLRTLEIDATPKEVHKALLEIIEEFKYPSR
ncbi:MAG: HyaD/HybD family hydrogenase maturation endopeptidase [Sulfuricurvum sp.]|uniref:HyaD/HybD family hydrogenase maturation endopeptidase n=1 Tax=Sulfuricurvum sp. TaxID=2025608 RepID=UPI0026097828|nr:HyaD/HybD family hydrogenase maturation endopeptidase [Sulfuricurvum sp.]MDD2830001.1 HyaD/HybD family hydrogenase maturation endopeptidase [Sulfuricurvum sp.]MDD4948400.1 HyaD/HybD family hydrogenase maturation endopeptidase [Sulfuricurvum sp.]